MRKLTTLAFVLLASVASAQTYQIPHDPHPLPACGGVVTCVDVGETLTINGPRTYTTLIVYGTLVLNPGAVITFTDTAPTDAGQYGTGLIVVGTFRANGTPITTWMRLAVEPAAGATTLTLAEPPTGWEVGDRIVVPDSRHLAASDITNGAPNGPRWEARTIASVSGAVVTLDSPLTYAHPGARDIDGVLELLPHVGHLSRSIVIRSPEGAATRGHTLYTGRADIDVRYVRFENLGRTTIAALNTTTNVAGRYAIHAHHLTGPVAPQPNGRQFTLIGNAVDGGDVTHTRKWGIAIHGSHYGLIQGNVVYNMAGAGVMFEDGSETENILDSNLVVRVNGVGDRLSLGIEGGGFWFRGARNRVRNNVAANTWGSGMDVAFGFKYFLRSLGPVTVPTTQGAMPSLVVNGNAQAIAQFANNETYGVPGGLTYWWINAPSGEPENAVDPAESVLSDTRIWHAATNAIVHYPASRLTFDGLMIRGGIHAAGTGWNGADYAQRDFVFRRVNMQRLGTGFRVTTIFHGPMTIEDASFRTDRDIYLTTMWNTGGGQNVRPRALTMRHTRHAPVAGRPYRPIVKDWNPGSRPPSAFNLPVSDELKVYAFQGNAADNFQAYYAIQATDNVAGGLAPCTTTRPEVIGGIACPIMGEAVDCEQSAWAYTSVTPWSPVACPVTGQQTAMETWTRYVVTEPQGSGAACGPASEERPIARSCAYIPATVNCTIQADGSPACTMTGWPLAAGTVFSVVIPQ